MLKHIGDSAIIMVFDLFYDLEAGSLSLSACMQLRKNIPLEEDFLIYVRGGWSTH